MAGTLVTLGETLPFTLSLSVDYGGRITRKGSGKRAKPFESYELLIDVVILVVVRCVVRF